MKIVTVSRQIGSYGDEIAELVAKRLGLHFIARAGLHELAMSCDPDYSDLCTAYETEHGPGFFERFFFDRPSHSSLFQALTFEQAAEGNVVIVGRGSQHVLRAVPNVFNASIVAPLEVRARRIQQRSGTTLEEARDLVRRHDEERNRLMRAVFGIDRDDWSEYDLVLNTAHYSAEDATDIVVCAVEGRHLPEEVGDVKDRLKAMAVAKRIETVVRRRLSSAVAHRVHVEGEPGGKMTVTGRVSEQKDKERISRIVSEQKGVTAVDNRLKVTEITFL